MPRDEDSRIASTFRDLPPEEREFLAEFARTGVASRRMWRLVVRVGGGLAFISGAIAGLILAWHQLTGR